MNNHKKTNTPGYGPIYSGRMLKISLLFFSRFSPKFKAGYGNLGDGFKKQASYQAYRLLPLPDVALNNQAGAH
jgi:hypothetical protein